MIRLDRAYSMPTSSKRLGYPRYMKDCIVLVNILKPTMRILTFRILIRQVAVLSHLGGRYVPSLLMQITLPWDGDRTFSIIRIFIEREFGRNSSG